MYLLIIAALGGVPAHWVEVMLPPIVTTDPPEAQEWLREMHARTELGEETNDR